MYDKYLLETLKYIVKPSINLKETSLRQASIVYNVSNGTR